MARRSIAEAPVDVNVTTNSSFVLAQERTYRKDPLNGFRKYTGGWNISEVHYMAVRMFTTWNCTSFIYLHNNMYFFLFAVSWIHSFSTVHHCLGVVCAVFSGYAWNLLQALLLSTSQLHILSGSICPISDTSNIVHLCCNVSTLIFQS